MNRDKVSRIITSVPVNSTAANVLRKGVHYEPDKLPNGGYWDAPPPTQRFKGLPEHDMSGKTVGRLTVVGYLGSTGNPPSATWLVRCNCGGYEKRRTRAIRNPANHLDRCYKCRHRIYVNRYEEFRRTGKNEL